MAQPHPQPQVFSLTCALDGAPSPSKKRTRSAPKCSDPTTPQFLRVEVLNAHTLFDVALLLLQSHPKFHSACQPKPKTAVHTWGFSIGSAAEEPNHNSPLVDSAVWVAALPRSGRSDAAMCKRVQDARAQSTLVGSSKLSLEPGKTLRFTYSSGSSGLTSLTMQCNNVRSLALLAHGTCTRDFPSCFTCTALSPVVSQVSPALQTKPKLESYKSKSISLSLSLSAEEQQNYLSQLLETPKGKGCIRRLLLDNDIGGGTSRGGGGHKKKGNGGVGCRRRRPLYIL